MVFKIIQWALIIQPLLLLIPGTYFITNEIFEEQYKFWAWLIAAIDVLLLMAFIYLLKWKTRQLLSKVWYFILMSYNVLLNYTLNPFLTGSSLPWA